MKHKKMKINYKKLFKYIFILALFIFLIFKLSSVIFVPKDNSKEIQIA